MSKVAITFIQGLVRELEVDGTEVIIRTADMDQILALTGQAEPLQAELANAPAAVIAAFSGYELDMAEKAALTAWLIGLVARNREAVKNIVAIATRLTPEFVGKLLPDRFLALLMLSIEVNADFFSRAMAGMLDMAKRLELGASGAEPQAAPTPATASTGLPPSSS